MILDKFYTKPEIAELCIRAVPGINTYDLILEPSAGSGSFSNQIPKCIAMDIAPEGEGICTQDYLEFVLPANCGRVLVIGNPPFGTRSSLAKSFIRHSIDLGASTIAFILPNTFNKLSNQKVFPPNWRLIKIIPLSGVNFTKDDKEYYVPCSFYIWTKEAGEVNLRATEFPQVPEFSFCVRGSKEASFVLNGNSGKIKDLNEVTNSKSEHYIKVNEGFDEQTIRNQLSDLEFDFNSSVNGGNAWLGQQDILRAYHEKYK